MQRTAGRRLRSSLLGLATTIALAGVMSGCERGNEVSVEPSTPISATPTTATTNAARDTRIRSVDFGNFTYPADSCSNFGDVPGGIVVRDGQYVPDESQVVGIFAADVVTAPVADLTGDGTEDAVVMLGCTGANMWAQAWVFTPDAASPTGVRRIGEVVIPERALATAGLTRVRLTDVAVAGAQVTSSWSGYRLQDAGCCPTSTVTATFEVTDNGLTLAGPIAAQTGA